MTLTREAGLFSLFQEMPTLPLPAELVGAGVDEGTGVVEVVEAGGGAAEVVGTGGGATEVVGAEGGVTEVVAGVPVPVETPTDTAIATAVV